MEKLKSRNTSNNEVKDKSGYFCNSENSKILREIEALKKKGCEIKYYANVVEIDEVIYDVDPEIVKAL